MPHRKIGSPGERRDPYLSDAPEEKNKILRARVRNSKGADAELSAPQQ